MFEAAVHDNGTTLSFECTEQLQRLCSSRCRLRFKRLAIRVVDEAAKLLCDHHNCVRIRAFIEALKLLPVDNRAELKRAFPSAIHDDLDNGRLHTKIPSLQHL